MTSMNHNHDLENKEHHHKLEPVLIVPKQLTKSAYAVLTKHNYVARRWHLDGRYGSRTFAYKEAKMGFPVLKSFIPIFERYKEQQQHQSSNDICNLEETITTNNESTITDKDDDLCTLIQTNEVEIKYLTVPIPKNIPRIEQLDSTIHPEKAYSWSFPSIIHSDCNTTKSSSTTTNNSQSTVPTPALTAKPLFTFMELFCGIGGFGVALERLGGQCIFASEIDPICCDIYKQNVNIISTQQQETSLNNTNNDDNHTTLHNNHKVYGDICKIPEKEFPTNCDLLVGGFPCQPFSRLGKQPGFEDTNNLGLLYKQIIRVLNKTKPQAFLLENVPGLHQMNHAFETIVEELKQTGYSVYTEILNARCLTAQSRKRLFFVGFRIGDDNTHVNKNSKQKYSFPYIPDLHLCAADIFEYDECDTHNFKTNDSSHHVKDTSSHEEDTNNTSLHIKSNLIISDDQMKQLLHKSKRWKPAHLAWPDRKCNTLDGHYGISIGRGDSELIPLLAPSNPRCFTPRECARLMGFPNSFTIPSKCQLEYTFRCDRSYYKQLCHMFGNAVCPPIIAALAGSILGRCKNVKCTNNIDRDESKAKDCRIDETEEFWVKRGLDVAIALALESTLPHRLHSIYSRNQIK